uniref:Uncharacterized protein n=1 Tax=Nitrosopumivirus cobalaminus TaxID=3158414 RepID=A0AAU7N628_9VIRU
MLQVHWYVYNIKTELRNTSLNLLILYISMVGLNKKDIKNAGFLFGPYDAIATTGTGATLALGTPTGQDNVWEHLGIPLSFEETLSSDVIDRRNIGSADLAELETINNNMISVTFDFNIPKIDSTTVIRGWSIERWINGESPATNFTYGGDGTAYTNNDSRENFSLRITDNESTPNTIVYRNGKITSISVTFDDGLYTVSCTAMFVGQNKSIETSFTEQLQPVLVNGGTAEAQIAIGPEYTVPLTNLDADEIKIKTGATTETALIRNLSVSKTFNTEWVKALGNQGVLNIVKISNSALTGSFEIQNIPNLSNSGFNAAVQTAFSDDNAELEFRFFTNPTLPSLNQGFIYMRPVVFTENKDTYSESDFATRNYSFSAITADIADTTQIT